MSRDDELACMIHALQERCEELEARVSFLEDGELAALYEGEVEGDEFEIDEQQIFGTSCGELSDADIG